MIRVLLSSHDGFGLGHVRRNARLAQALLRCHPDAHVTLVTGLAHGVSWLSDERVDVVRVPPLLKQSDGAYHSVDGGFEAAVAARALTFRRVVDDVRPDVVVVDRHPYGTAGELRSGLEAAKARGASIVLGLRDVLDEPAVVAVELAGAGWAGVQSVYDAIVVYGDRVLCDHEQEYGLPLTPTYVGWVTDGVPVIPPNRVEPRRGDARRRLVVAAGGGGDGDATFELGLELARARSDWDVAIVAGPFANPLDLPNDRRVRVHHNVDTEPLLRGADAVLQMAGYNSTVEALSVGLRPMLVPRRSPRREQAIRAGRLAAMGLAHVVDMGARADEVAWLLDRDHHLDQDRLAASGISLGGADRAAEFFLSTAGVRQ